MNLGATLGAGGELESERPLILKQNNSAFNRRHPLEYQDLTEQKSKKPSKNNNTPVNLPVKKKGLF
jgi:hypothetical protein